MSAQRAAQEWIDRGASFSFEARQELDRGRAVARLWSAAIPDTDRPALAALFARRAFEAFAAEKAPALALKPYPTPSRDGLDLTTRQLATSLGRAAASLPTLEGSHFLTSLYTALLPNKKRSALGAFYTPPCLVRRLLDLATEGGADWGSARVLDPASGGGGFLLEAAFRIRRALEGSEPAFILAQLGTRLAGLEIDPDAAWLSQASLDVFLADLATMSGREVPQFVKVCDTLEEPATEVYDLIVGNPPYGRVALTDAQRRRFARGLYGHANLYGVFTDIALRWTKPSGLIAYLTPTSMMSGQYYSALRELLAEQAPPSAVDFVHARRGVFEDVLQETLLALYRKGGERGRFQVHHLNIDSDREIRATKNGTVSLPDDARLPWLAPRAPQHARLIATAQQFDSRLVDWGYEVATGPLVWNRHKPQLRGHVARGLHPIIWAEAVTADGRFVFRAEKRNHAPYFQPQKGDDWLLMKRSCILLQRTTAKEQTRRLIAAELSQSFIDAHGGVVVENHLNMIRAKAAPKVSAAVVAAVLNSDVVDQIFRCISGSVAVSAFELEAIPLPPLTRLTKLKDLVANGASRKEVEQELQTLYQVGA